MTSPAIIAQRLHSSLYLVQTSPTHGYTVDISQHIHSPQLPLVSILARGYWNLPARDTPQYHATLTAVANYLTDDATDSLTLFNPNHDARGRFGVGDGGTAAGVGKTGKGRTSKAAQAKGSGAQSRGYTIGPVGKIGGGSKAEEEKAAKQRVTAARKRVTVAEKTYADAEKASAAKRAANADEISRLQIAQHAAYVRHFDSYREAKDAIEEARAHEKGASGKAPKTYERMQAARQPYEDAKAIHEAAKAKSDASSKRADDLLAQYHDPSKSFNYDQMMKDHPDLKAAMREKWRDSSATDKAQRALYRTQNKYEGPRSKLAGEVKDTEIEAHPLRTQAKASLDEANARLAEATGEKGLRAAFDAREAARSELKNAQYDLKYPESRYDLTASVPTNAAKYTDLAQWPQASLNAATRAEAIGRQRIASGEEARHVGDQALRELQREQGFDGKPDIVRETDLERGIKLGGDTELWRGDTKEGHTDNYMTGEYHAGLGIRGNGTYSQEGSDGHVTARSYATNRGSSVDNGRVMHMALKSDAKIIDYETLRTEARQAAQAAHHQLLQARANGDQQGARRANSLVWLASGDSSRFAVARGYDAIRIASHGQMIILNRTALRISRKVRPGDYTG